MENQTNQGIKALAYSILAFLIILIFLNSNAIIKSLGGHAFTLFCVLIIGVIFVFVSQVKSIHYIDDAFKITHSGFSKPKIITIKKEEIIKIAFHGKDGRRDNYWIKFYLKDGYPQRFDLNFESKYIFTLLDKIKEYGFIVEYE